MILTIIKFCKLLLRIYPGIINSLRSYIKHSKECFLLFSNTSKLVKKKKKLGCASFYQPTSRCSERFFLASYFAYMKSFASLAFCVVRLFRNSGTLDKPTTRNTRVESDFVHAKKETL